MLYELLGFRDKEFPAGLGWHDRIVEGFPQAALWSLARRLEVQAEDVATLVGFPPDQLDWRERKSLLSADLSDTLFRIAVAYHRLYTLFKDSALCSNWLRTARKETGNQIPVILLTTSPGARLVFEAIERIKPPKNRDVQRTEEVVEPSESSEEDNDESASEAHDD